MDAIIERCAGLDVHQATVVACVLIGEAGRKPRKEIRTFSTLTRDLKGLRDWLKELGVTHIGMESTGVYWKPVHAILEGHFELIVANAHHIRNVPGRKTDVKDAEWLADLVRHGLIKPSFVPPPPIRQLRDLVRLRRSVSEALTTEQNRTLKLLETANIKLASVVSQVFGVSGRAMLKALIENTATPQEMADLAKRKLRRKLEPLALALDGRLTEHHRYLLAFHLRRVEAIEADLRALDERIEEKARPYQAQRRLLRQIPGVDDRIALSILAEIGIDMSVFGNARRLGRGLSRLSRERRKEEERGAPQGQRPPRDDPRSGRGLRRPDQGPLLQGQVPPAEGAPGFPAGRHGHRAQDPGRRVPQARQNRSLPGTRRGLPGSTGMQAHHDQPGPAPRQPRIRRPPPAKGRRMTLRLHRARSPPSLIFGTASFSSLCVRLLDGQGVPGHPVRTLRRRRHLPLSERGTGA